MEVSMSKWVSEYLDAWNSHNGERVAAFMAEDVSYEDLALGQVHEGRAAIIGFVQASEEFSKDHKFEFVSEQTSGDRYALEWEMVGTNTGDAGGLPATNKPFRIRGVSVGTLDPDGKIKHNRDYWNMADYLMQVGVLPTPE
jgi:steroid delta-isomerase-like uncharacterized protein